MVFYGNDRTPILQKKNVHIQVHRNVAELKFKVLASLGKLAFYFSFITKHWFC